MTVDPVLLDLIMKSDSEPAPRFLLHLNGISHLMEQVAVTDSPTPVSRPTMRGGSYFSDKTVHRITGTICRTDLAPCLTGKMLGPNTEFEVLRIDAVVSRGGMLHRLVIAAHLTNSVQTPDSTELGMVIVGLESA